MGGGRGLGERAGGGEGEGNSQEMELWKLENPTNTGENLDGNQKIPLLQVKT